MNLTIPFRPVPKGRPRKGRNGRMYTPKETRDYEDLVGMIARQHFKKPLDGPLAITMRFYVKGRRADCDNYMKSLLDGLNGVAWNDDRQIVKWSGEIVNDSPERTEISIDTESVCG